MPIMLAGNMVSRVCREFDEINGSACGPKKLSTIFAIKTTKMDSRQMISGLTHKCSRIRLRIKPARSFIVFQSTFLKLFIFMIFGDYI
jgi:hypothetical protein